MRYHSARKYPITQTKKKEMQTKKSERVLDLSVGTAVGLMALVFVEGIFWGYMIKKWRS